MQRHIRDGGDEGSRREPTHRVDRSSVDVRNGAHVAGVEHNWKLDLSESLAHKACRSLRPQTLDDFINEHNKPISVVEVHLSGDVVLVEDVRLDTSCDGRCCALRLLVVNDHEAETTGSGSCGVQRSLAQPVERAHGSLAPNVLISISPLGAGVQEHRHLAGAGKCWSASRCSVDELQLRLARDVLEHRAVGDSTTSACGSIDKF